MRYAVRLGSRIALFERPHHQGVAQVLSALDGPLLRENKCLFGGGTLIALLYGEYRESVDIDFMVSDLAGYRTLRQLLTGPRGIAAIVRLDAIPLKETRALRADQYGIRTALLVGEEPIKLKIVLEGRVELAAPTPSDEVCGIATLTALDMVTGKLLANSDRWADDAAFSRDLIDLAMMSRRLGLLREAVAKAEHAYGGAILQDLEKAIDRMQNRDGWLERCMLAMAINLPKAQIWQRIRALRRILPSK